MAMADRLLQTGKFSFFLKEVVAFHTLLGRPFQMLSVSKVKLFPKCLTDLVLQYQCMT